MKKIKRNSHIPLSATYNYNVANKIKNDWRDVFMKMTKWMASTGLILGLLVGCSSEQPAESVEPTVVEPEEPVVSYDEILNGLVKNITWTIEKDEWGDTIATGVLENTTDEEIEYIEIEYKFKKDDITVDSSWTNAINIAPGEKVQIEIYTFEEFDTLEVEGSDGF